MKESLKEGKKIALRLERCQNSSRMLKESPLLAKAAYCGFCATYGHFSSSCKYHKSIEQKPVVLKRVYFEPLRNNTLFICKSEKSLRSFLYFYKLSVCQKLDSNIKNVRKFCKEQGWSLVFIDPADSETDYNEWLEVEDAEDA